MNPNLQVRIISTAEEMAAARRIREIVFVHEQQVDPEIEYDEFESSSTHVMASIEGEAVGTARWRHTSKGYKLERFAVLKSHRGEGVGSGLLHFVLQQIQTDEDIYLNAQMGALDFYAAHGFKAVGDIFYEANIPHRKMILSRASE